ncbi:Vgb family protein [Dokdonella immobilis]|uniref:SMP-30/Gluconolaconase/LRE-like region-containing protein n=1 Tax=Dokdonella immobilis TaxID=578942 RepID=A0A1I5AAH7_9GAMM|nr:hypothetical protein [Dokdonella immobilis]SFN59413.1 hypothetical protein SAMN05216289_13427 [Dokdonella immobilis]
MPTRIAIAALILISISTAACAQPCSHHLLVSGYFSNNVAIYDACNGTYLRQLEQAGRIQGAQAVRWNPIDDLIYVVSEGNDQIQRYRRNSSYEFVDVFAQLASNFDPTGIDFGLDDEVYVASYGLSQVVELDPVSGLQTSVLLPSNSGLQGADNGLMASVIGLVYVPGYDSNSVARVDPESGQIQASFVPPGTAGLLETRGIVDEGATILVGGEGSGAIYRFNAMTGAFVATLVSGLSRPTGMALGVDGSLLVLTGNRVRRYDRSTGADLGVLANGVTGGISGGTFVALVPNPDSDLIYRNGFDPAD